MNRDSFFKFQNESIIDDSRKFENRAYPFDACVSDGETSRQELKSRVKKVFDR